MDFSRALTEREKNYRTFAQWYAYGRLDERDAHAYGIFKVAEDFGNYVVRLMIDGMQHPSLYTEWERYADELQSLVVVVLGDPSDDTYGIFQ